MARLRKGGNLCQKIKHLVWGKHILKKAKVTKLKTYFIPIITHHCQEWTTYVIVHSFYVKKWRRVQTSEMICIRVIKGKTRWDRIRNYELRKRIFQYSLREKCRRQD